jgi:YVTN family beta-propeller protein
MSSNKFIGINSFGRSLLRAFRKDDTELPSPSFTKEYGSVADDYFLEQLNEKLGNCLKPASTSKEKKAFHHFDTQDNKERTDLIPNSLSKRDFVKLFGKEKRRAYTPSSQSIVADTFQEFKRLQVTVHNSSNKDKEIFLWGGNLAVNSITNVDYTDVDQHTIVLQQPLPGVSPQGVSYNPVNQYIYIANQISGSVSVMDSSNIILRTIQLNPPFPGLNSPVAIAANINPASVQYGYVYVTGSVADTISIIDTTLNLIGEIPIGSRPVSIAFNPVNNLVYVANMGDNTLAVFDPETSAVVRILITGQEPLGVGINTTNGEIYAANFLDDSISVFDVTNALVTTIAGIVSGPVSATCNPLNGLMYVSATSSNQVYIIDNTHTVIATRPTGSQPYNSIFNPDNGYIYIQNRLDNTLTVLASDNSLVATLSLGEQNIGGAYNTVNHCFYISDTLNNSVNIIGYDVSILVQVDTDYDMIRNDFQFSPAIIEHARFCVTGSQHIYKFRLLHYTPTGRVSSKAISFEQFASPEHRLNIAEAYPLSGTVIDGKTQWRFMLPALHSVGILLWIRQFELIDLMNKRK